MRLSIHLTFAGNCRAAFEYYERALGGTGLSLFTYGETPAGAGLPEEMRAQIVHGSIKIGGALVSGADVAPAEHVPSQGFYALLSVESPAQAERIFAALAEGGSIRMPLGKTFWSPAFGVVVDRFGVPWEVSAEG